MKASTPRTSSRLAAVANARRRQRKERLSGGSPMAAQSPLTKNSPMSAKSPMARSSPLARQSPLIVKSPTVMRSPAARQSPARSNPVTQPKTQTVTEHSTSDPPTIATNPTDESNADNNENINHSNTLQTLPTDDESLSTWSQAQSTVSGFTDDSFFINNASSSKPNQITTSKSRKPKNITVITEEVMSPRDVLSPVADSSNITFRQSSSKNRMTSPNVIMTPNRRVFSPRTPKTSNNAVEEDNSRSMMKRIDELTRERDRLRSHGNLYKHKLQEAVEAKSVMMKEKDDQIAELMKSVGNLTVLIDEAESVKEAESVMERQTIKEMQLELSNTVCQLNKLKGSYEMLKHANAAGATFMDLKMQKSTIKAEQSESCVKQLKEDLVQVVSEKDELEIRFADYVDELERVLAMDEVHQATISRQAAAITQLKRQLDGKQELESNFDECVEELGRVHGEEEKQHATIQQQTATIELLKKQLENSLAKYKADLSQKDDKISDILDEKFEIETALQEKIYELESRMKALINDHKEEKHGYESTIKKLKEQISAADQKSEEAKMSLIQGMEDIKCGHAESIDAYKKKMADLESKVELANKDTESVKRELSDAKTMFAIRLEECKKERNEIDSRLEKVTNDFGQAKTARGKDIDMLKSELEKAYASKLEADKQLQDTRRQLHNALHSLDEMAFDGGKMRSELNRIMNHLYNEKDSLHRELVDLRLRAEDQESKIYHLNQDNNRYEQTCSELRAQISQLERNPNKSMGRYGMSTDEKDMMELEIKYLKNMLEKASATSQIDRCGKSENNEALIEELKANEKANVKELSAAKQTIQKLKTKERYLESRVESLANQITQTVQEYETRLGEARESRPMW